MAATKTAEKKVASTPALRQPQVRILEALAKSKKPLTRKMIVEATGLDTAWMTTWCGPQDATARKASDEKYKLLSLTTRKYIAEQIVEDERGVAYTITAAGRKALEAAKQAAK